VIVGDAETQVDRVRLLLQEPSSHHAQRRRQPSPRWRIVRQSPSASIPIDALGSNGRSHVIRNGNLHWVPEDER